jgi:hypothetical protein
MSSDRAEAVIETAIAKHVAASFAPDGSRAKSDAHATQIRNRIIDSFEPGDLLGEQDNRPPALVSLYQRITAAFSHIETNAPVQLDRLSELAGLKGSLQDLRRSQSRVGRSHLLEHAKARLLNERQQLFMKNELTEGFGRIEAWALSITFLVLVLLETVSILWALPLLALSVGRSWYLDRQCKRRLKKIAEIDALIDRIDLAPQGASGLNAP